VQSVLSSNAFEAEWKATSLLRQLSDEQLMDVCQETDGN